MTPRDRAARLQEASRRRARGRHGRKFRRRIAYLLLIGYAFLMFIPFLWSVVTSFKTIPDSLRLTVIPQPFTPEGWQYAFTQLTPPIQVLFLNSLIIAAVVTITNLVLGSMAGYAFARLRFPGREVLFIVVLATLMIPDQLRFVPVYLLSTAIGFTRGIGQYFGVILSWRSRRRASSCSASTSCRCRATSRRRRRSTAPASSRLPAGDAAARRPGPRGRRDPPVPGHLERLLLAAPPARRPGPLTLPLGLSFFRLGAALERTGRR